MSKKLQFLPIAVVLLSLQQALSNTPAPPLRVWCNKVEFTLEVNSSPINSSRIDIAIEGAEDEIVLLVLTDVLGRDVYSNSLVESSGNYLFSLPLEEPLIPGVYFIMASSNDEYMSKRIVVR